MDSVCGRKQAGKVEGNSCLSAGAAEASQTNNCGQMKDLIKSDSKTSSAKKWNKE